MNRMLDGSVVRSWLSAGLVGASLFIYACGSSGDGGGGAGTAGTTGSAGTTGGAGTTGAAGMTGVSGTTGGSGTTGVSGTTGGSGTTGAAGRGGTTGTAGVAGTGGAGGGAGYGGASGRGGSTGTAGTGGRGGTAGTAGASGRGGTTGTAGTGGSGLSNFSFFVTSLRAIRAMTDVCNGTHDEMGLGGDLRCGETGDGAGLRGADKICAKIAEQSMPGAGAKQWRAFLSAPAAGSMPQVNAIDRIGNGPWYDRMGRLFSMNKTNLIGFRPSDANSQIKNDFPNEDGIPNHNPDGTGQVDNHDTLTGTDSNGMLYTNGSTDTTCQGWTFKGLASGHPPRVGHAWPRSACTNATNTCAVCGMGFGGVGTGGRGGGGETLGCYGHWMSSLDEGGCAPGINLQEMGGPMNGVYTVGTGGGYGAFFCFATTP